jgi:hypothetical protein
MFRPKGPACQSCGMPLGKESSARSTFRVSWRNGLRRRFRRYADGRATRARGISA